MEDKDNNENFSLVQSINQHIDDTRRCALDMVINRASFLMMVFHLAEMKPLLNELVKGPGFCNTEAVRAPLHQLAATLRNMYNFTHGCLSRSRIFLLYFSDGVVDEISRHFNQLSLCLSGLLTSCPDLPSELKGSIQVLQAKFMSSSISQEPGYSILSKEISACLDGSNANEYYATGLLRKIANFLKVAEFEAGELKQELQADLEKAEADGLESADVLRPLNRLFSSAQVINERRSFASMDSPLLPAGLSEVPSSFICPITKSIMREPVMIAEEGFTYEKSAILEWFSRGHKTCPDTGKELQSLALVPNLKLQQAMDEFFNHRYQAEMVYALQALRNQGMDMSLENAVHCVKRLTDLGSKYKQLVVSLDGIEVLVGLLKPSPPHIRGIIMKVLIDVSTEGDAQKVAIIEAGVVRILLSLLQKNPTDKSGSSQLLLELSKIPDGKIAIVSEKGSMLIIAAVLNLSQEVDRPQIRVLLDNLCRDDTDLIMEAARSTIFEPLVASLTHGVKNTKYGIINTLATSFDLGEFNSVAMVNAGIVPALLDLLQGNDSPEAIQAAMRVLAQISYTERNKVPIAKAGAIPVMVKFLSYPLDQVKIDATSVLSDLATDSCNVHEMDSEGVLVGLCQRIKIEDTVLQEYSLKALGFMTKDSPTVRSRVVELGMVPTLYTLLGRQTSSMTCQRSILNILCHIIKDAEDPRAIVPSVEGTKYLIGLLESCSDLEQRVSIFGILEALSKAEDMVTAMLSEEKLLPASMYWVQQVNPLIRESATGLLSRFANYGLKQPPIQAAFSEVLPAFLAVIDDESSTKMARQYAAEGMFFMSSCTPSVTAQNSDAQGCLARMGFKQLKACKVHGGKCSTTETFCLVEAGAIPSLVKLIDRGEVQSAEWAVRALYTLVDGTRHPSKGIDILMNSNILVPVVKLVGKDQSSTEASVKMLEKIFRIRKYRDAKTSGIAKTVLMATMATESSEVRKLAATALMHLKMINPDTSYATGTT